MNTISPFYITIYINIGNIIHTFTIIRTILAPNKYIYTYTYTYSKYAKTSKIYTNTINTDKSTYIYIKQTINQYIPENKKINEFYNHYS